MRCPIGWYRFNDRLLGFDFAEEKWEILNRNASYARAGAVLAIDGENFYYVGGELKPGIRTPEIKEFSFLIK
jgi:sialate O-acetylesterase